MSDHATGATTNGDGVSATFDFLPLHRKLDHSDPGTPLGTPSLLVVGLSHVMNQSVIPCPKSQSVMQHFMIQNVIRYQSRSECGPPVRNLVRVWPGLSKARVDKPGPCMVRV